MIKPIKKVPPLNILFLIIFFIENFSNYQFSSSFSIFIVQLLGLERIGALKVLMWQHLEKTC